MGKSSIAVGSSNYARSASTLSRSTGLKQRFKNWLFDVSKETKAIPYYEDMEQRANFEGGMTFTIHKASGGLVVNVHHYDPTRDRSQSNLYVIQEDDNIGENITKILTMENLKR